MHFKIDLQVHEFIILKMQSADLTRDVMQRESMGQFGMELASWKNASKKELLDFIEENVWTTRTRTCTCIRAQQGWH